MFQEVSEGQFTERVAPFLMQAAPFAGVDRLPFQQALQNAVRDKRKVCLCMCCCRTHSHVAQPLLCIHSSTMMSVMATPAQLLPSFCQALQMSDVRLELM